MLDILPTLQPGAAESRRDPMPLPATGLDLERLEVFRGDYCVCADLSMRIVPGAILHLRGENGAGKTSLLRVLAGLALPERGVVRYGADGLRPRDPRYRESLRYIAHRDGVKLELTARENLRLAVRLISGAGEREADAALARVGLGALGDRRGAELSAGQRRRLALARLLPGRSGLWLLDEPLANLDAGGGRLVESLLGSHLATGGVAVLATHQPLSLTGMNVMTVDLPQVKRGVH